MHAGLSALVVHDLKNRLAVHEQRLAELLDAQPALAGAIAPLRADAAALQRRLIAFLALYRHDAHGLAVDEREEAPAGALAQAAGFARTLAARPGLAVEVDASDAPSSWFFDAWLVGLALEAAVDNAARYASTAIRLAARVDDDVLVLSVEDDGSGLADADDALHASPARTGLGTELCRAVARLHACDGRVGELRLVDRATEGARGTRFELRLP